MTTGNRIFVVAATVQAANDRVRLLTDAERTDYGIVPVLNDADMRGRSVIVGDLVLVAGDWSGVQHDRVKRLCAMFNTRRDLSLRTHEVPMLRYKPGEAPEVGYPDPPKLVADQAEIYVGNTAPAQPGAGALWVNTSTSTTTSTWDGDPIEVQTLNGNKFTFGIETDVLPAGSGGAPSHTDAEVQKLLQELEDARDLIKVNDKLVTAMSEQVQQLRSWLSGVQPVEDPEIPGIFWCAVCSKQLPAHADGCPAAP